ncbi:hypothetical protein [Natronococcus wangiae]|uniref:hypothetical protein n=1 Tax=Natronococcus wangiae TaxID=3068275 RepID=UPI00273E39C4|nr:hypothetical protein [Natronococcus sp. AD5]
MSSRRSPAETSAPRSTTSRNDERDSAGSTSPDCRRRATASSFYEGREYERVREYERELSSRVSTGVTGTVGEMKREP